MMSGSPLATRPRASALATAVATNSIFGLKPLIIHHAGGQVATNQVFSFSTVLARFGFVGSARMFVDHQRGSKPGFLKRQQIKKKGFDLIIKILYTQPAVRSRSTLHFLFGCVPLRPPGIAGLRPLARRSWAQMLMLGNPPQLRPTAGGCSACVLAR